MTHAQEELFSDPAPETNIDPATFAAGVAKDALQHEPRPIRTSEAYHDLGGNVPEPSTESTDPRVSARNTTHSYYSKEFRLTGPTQPTEEQQAITHAGAAHARKVLGIPEPRKH
jgi:hypothetical protein